jgi:hypothetical protein
MATDRYTVNNSWIQIANSKCLIDVEHGDILVAIGTTIPTANVGHRVPSGSDFCNPFEVPAYAKTITGVGSIVVSDEA